jgi:hypothetical protein
LRSAIAPAARKRPLPAAKIDGVEVSWRFRTEMLATMPASGALDRRGDADGAGAAVRNRTSPRSCYTLIREHGAASKRAPAQRLGRRGEGLSLLYDIGDENDALGVASLTTRMRRFGRDVEAIAFFDRAGRLTLDGKLEAAFQHIGGFDPRMRVPRDGRPALWSLPRVASHSPASDRRSAIKSFA